MSADARTARIRRALREPVPGPDRAHAAAEFDDLVRDYQRVRAFAEQYGYASAEVTQRIEVGR